MYIHVLTIYLYPAFLVIQITCIIGMMSKGDKIQNDPTKLKKKIALFIIQFKC